MTNEITLASSELPAHLQNTVGAGRGNEDMAATDLSIPRLKLLQRTNDETDPHHPKYIQGAEVGSFCNTLTGKCYKELYVVSIKFKHQFQVWSDKRKFGGNYPSAAAAKEYIANQDNPAEWTISETHTHLLLIKDAETGQTDTTPVIMDFSNTKLKVSRDWNSQIVMKGGDRFAGLWKLGTVSMSNDKGSWVNITTEFVGWAQEDDYKAAEALYEQHAD
jgi:hypothetical protein